MTRKTVVIHCWSAPRSRSTALMYSFEARADCQCLDEPLYHAWIQAQGDAVDRPYLNFMLTGQGPTEKEEKGFGANWKREQLSLEERITQAAAIHGTQVIFCKHMAKHAPQYDFHHQLEGFNHVHLLLLRDPVAVMCAWSVAGANHGNVATPDEVGIGPLWNIYSILYSQKQSPRWAVLDADDLVQDPPTVLEDICAQLGIEYTKEMLSWSAGPHECDGAWASWWYKSVWNSTGWSVAQDNKYRTLPPALYPALQASLPAFEFLQQFSLGYRRRGPPPPSIYEDSRNEHLLVYIGASMRRKGRLVPRSQAGISPWDSSVQGGDATWEGLRVHRGKILSLDKHLRRLQRSAKALEFENVHTSKQITEAIFQTLAANGMRDAARIRLTLTRGEKCTSGMDPKFNVYGTTLIILPEWKTTEEATTIDNTGGISLITASQRRSSPATCDSKMHHNNILPKIQANLANCADAIVLDVDGFVCETNSSNLFMVDDEGTLLTPHADHCLPGITRGNVLILAQELQIPHQARRVSLPEFHAATEVFTTTMGEITPVTCIDGRVIGEGKKGPVTAQLQTTYQSLAERQATAIPCFE